MSQPNQLAAKQREIVDKYTNLRDPKNVYKIPGQNATDMSKFPVQLGGYNAKEDQKWSLRNQMIDQSSGVVPGVGQAIAPEEYFDYIQSKQEDLTANSFIAWVLSIADLSSPESAQWWYSHFPWMKQLRLDYAKKQHDLDWKMTELTINGPQNDEDLMLQWMVEMGNLTPPTTPTWQLYKKDVNDNYVAGLFSPMANPKNQTPHGTELPIWGNPLQFANQPGPFPYSNQISLPSLLRQGDIGRIGFPARQ